MCTCINAQKYSQYCGTSLPKAKYLVQGTTDFTIFKTAIVQYDLKEKKNGKDVVRFNQISESILLNDKNETLV